MAHTVRVALSCRTFLVESFPSDAERLERGIVHSLESCTADFRRQRRLSALPDSTRSYFEMSHIIRHENGFASLRIIVDDTAALDGILDGVYIERTSSSPEA
jgi:hypothetical protein